jgi:low temperature requirement protein LtrA
MLPRDPGEGHRAASPLELFFDLVFVVAVTFAAQNLGHIEIEGRIAHAVFGYGLVFFAIWWAWVNFTWFATSFDTDDWLYRITTFVQMAGVLVLAAGIEAGLRDGNFFVMTMGYVVMRLAMVSQWLRAAWSSPEYRRVALRYALAITIVQALWVLRVTVLPEWGTATFCLFALGEVLVPIWAERGNMTPWHRHHLAERYSLFTLIVLGEGLAASANTIIDALGEAEHLPALFELASCGLVIVAGLWWIYFSREQHSHITSMPSALLFGYGHFFVFAAAGAIPAGIEVALAAESGHAALAPATVMATITVPVAVFVLAIWLLALRPTLSAPQNAIVVVLAVGIAASALVPAAALVTTALLVAAIVVVLEVAARRADGGDPASGNTHRMR